MQDSRSFPNIYKAALEMSYDNGGINRDRSEEKHREELDAFLGQTGHDFTDLKKIDDWIGHLTDDQVQILIAGEDEERYALIATAPHEFQQKLDELLDTIFEEVC